VPTLEALLDSADFEVLRVVTQPDRPRGRGRKLSPTEVKACAFAHDIAVDDMTRDSYAGVAAGLRALTPDFLVVVAFGIIFKADLLELPRYGCVNLHASLLPRHRGVSPVHQAILSGDAETGVTTMFMDAGIDTGDILLQTATPIEASDTTGVLEGRLSSLGAPLMVETLRGLRAGTLSGREQDDARATYTKKIRKKHGRIDWSRPAIDIERRIRAMQPWPTAYSALDGRRVIVTEAAVEEARPDLEDAPGMILSRTPLRVATGAGVLRLVRVKPEGKKEMAAESFVAGYRVQVGSRLITPDLIS